MIQLHAFLQTLMTIVSVPALEVLITTDVNPSALLCHGYITEVRVYTCPMCLREFMSHQRWQKSVELHDLKYLVDYDLIRNTVGLHTLCTWPKTAGVFPTN